MQGNLIKSLVLSAAFAAAAPAIAGDWKTTVASSDVTDAASEHFVETYSGTLNRSCDLMAPGSVNPKGTAIAGILNVSKADMRRLSHILPDDVQAKSYDEQTVWINALPPDELARVTEKFHAYQKQDGFLPAIKNAFDVAFPGVAGDYDAKDPQAMVTQLKTLADNISGAIGASVSITVTVTDFCAKPSAP